MPVPHSILFICSSPVSGPQHPAQSWKLVLIELGFLFVVGEFVPPDLSFYSKLKAFLDKDHSEHTPWDRWWEMTS